MDQYEDTSTFEFSTFSAPNYIFPRNLCGLNNTAVYGLCIASEFRRLVVSNAPESAFAGIPFNLTINKLDAYDNVIQSDSASTIKAVFFMHNGLGFNPLISIIGSGVVELNRGSASLVLAVKPTFTDIEFGMLAGQTSFSLQGWDSQSENYQIYMMSDIEPLNLRQGNDVCPSGYILDFEGDAKTAFCSICKPGTYSLQPLRQISTLNNSLDRSKSGALFGCINCPAGGECFGGTEVEFKIGLWENIGGMYVLKTCPSGYTLKNSTDGTSKGTFSDIIQECRLCPHAMYIINSQDDCQTCPPGLICRGDEVVQSAIAGSVWIPKGDIFFLVSCPGGYEIFSSGDRGFDATAQSCQPCSAGTECTHSICITCSLCPAGKFKSTKSSAPCEDCNVDTYNSNLGSMTKLACETCPLMSTTKGLRGQVNTTSCQCTAPYYMGSATCLPCPLGAICLDGACAFPSGFCSDHREVIGNWTQIGDEWTLVNCPAGYFLNLNTQGCISCPVAFYCIGGKFPPAPCDQNFFSLSGSDSQSSCTPSVFVFVTVRVDILRPYFNDAASISFQAAISNLTDVATPKITLDAIVQSIDSTATLVTCKLAMSDSGTAALLIGKLENALNVTEVLAFLDFPSSLLISTKVTSCVPGYELLSSQVCSLCPPTYYCIGGTAGRSPCPSGYYSKPGVSTSTLCVQSAFIIITALLQISVVDFTDSIQLSFRSAVALAANATLEKVSIDSYFNKERALDRPLLSVISEIAVVDSDVQTMMSMINTKSVDASLEQYGLPKSVSLSVAVLDTNSHESTQIPLTFILGGSIGGLVFLIIFGLIGYYFVTKLVMQVIHRSFLSAFRCAKVNDHVSVSILPFKLRKQFHPEKIVAKGASYCVVKAKKKESNVWFSIKLRVPEEASFTHQSLQQLKREENVFMLLTSKKCDHSALLAGLGAVKVSSDVCWFVMEYLDGETMERSIYSSLDGVHHQRRNSCLLKTSDQDVGTRHFPIDDFSCIMLARGILAALKIMHTEELLHRDVKPANIMRCRVKSSESNEDGGSYTYKIIEFGTVLSVSEVKDINDMLIIAENTAVGALSPPYMSPEMYRQPQTVSFQTDIWSLGVSMFELVTAFLPFQAEYNCLWSISIAGNMDEKLPNVLDRLSESRRAKFDNNLASVIATAIEKRVANRYSKQHTHLYIRLKFFI